MTSFVNRYTQAPVRFAIEAAALIDFLSRTPNILKIAFSKAFRNSIDNFRPQDSLVSASAAGWQWKEKNGLFTADAL